ncbi:MAG: GNAT family N-acetyltransferase [Bacillota bacterium]
MNGAFLIGNNVYLRPFESEDLIPLYQWNNDPELRAQTGAVRPTSKVGIQKWFERMSNDESRIWFAVVRRSDDKVIGEAGLLRMYPEWRTTDLTIIIGDHEARGQGYGGEAIRLLLDYAFGYLSFHRVSIGVVGFNEQAIRFYERVGFRREGIQRDGYYYNHKFSDFVMMSILDSEFVR